MSLTVPVREIVTNSTNLLLSKHSTWERVTLREIARITNGFPFESRNFSNERTGKPLIRIRDVGEDDTDTFYSGTFSRDFLIQPGDLLIGMDGDFRSAIWRGSEGLLNQRVCKVEVYSGGYLPAFLVFVLPGYLGAIHDLTSAVTVKHLSSRSIEDIPLPLPPLAEQERIVTKLEELFTRLDAGIALTKRTKALLKRYRQSVLKSAVEGELSREWREAQGDTLEDAETLLERILDERREKWTASGRRGKYEEPESPDIEGLPELPKGWTWATFEQLGEWGGGGTPSKANAAFWENGSVPWVSPKDMKSWNIVDSEDKITHEAVTQSATKHIHAPSLLFVVRSGILRRILPTAILKVDGTVNQDLRALTPHIPSTTNYLMVFSQARNDEIRTDCMKDGTTVESIAVPALQIYPVAFPTLAEQEFIVLEVERRLSVIDEMEASLSAELKRAESLRRSILHRAFTGRLVPQNPSDEPAIVLLERIQAERIKAGAAAIRGRGRKAKTEAEEDSKVSAKRGRKAKNEQERLIP